MRFVLLTTFTLAVGIFTTMAAAREPDKELAIVRDEEGREITLALLQVDEQPTDGKSELVKLKIQRYNACVRALRKAKQLHAVGKLDTFELGDISDALVTAALHIHNEGGDRIQFLEKHVEFADYFHKQAVIGPPLGAGPSPYQIARTESRLLDAKVKLLEAQEKLRAEK